MVKRGYQGGMRGLAARLPLLLASKHFFYATLTALATQASWIAASGRFSMPFDENYHFGIIKLYAQHWSPFWASQPPGAEAFGAVSRDPSYLYHYLMSWPYRLIEEFAHTQMAQVISLRLMNVLILVAGLVIYRRVLLRATASVASPALAQGVLAIFVLIPIVPFLAAQINYDNLLFLAVGLSLWLALLYLDDLRAKKAINPMLLGWLLVVCLLSSLVKYAFLPIFMAIVLWLAIQTWLHVRKLGRNTAFSQLRRSLGVMSLPMRVLLLLGLVLSFGLFAERYGFNLLRYRTPTPECDQVMSVEECKAYAPWFRNYQAHEGKVAGTTTAGRIDPISYTARSWLKVNSYQLFYSRTDNEYGFAIGKPLLLPSVLLGGVSVLGGGLALIYWRRLYQHRRLRFLVFVAGVYVGLLWLQQYADFLHLGAAVAIQARYLVAVLPIFAMLLALVFQEALRGKPAAKSVLAGGTLAVLLLQGGGVGVYIVRSNPNWWWPNQTVVRANQAAQKVFRLLIIDT